MFGANYLVRGIGRGFVQGQYSVADQSNPNINTI